MTSHNNTYATVWNWDRKIFSYTYSHIVLQPEGPDQWWTHYFKQRVLICDEPTSSSRGTWSVMSPLLQAEGPDLWWAHYFKPMDLICDEPTTSSRGTWSCSDERTLSILLVWKNFIHCHILLNLLLVHVLYYRSNFQKHELYVILKDSSLHSTMHLYQWEHGEVHGTCWPDHVLTTTKSKAYMVCMLASFISEPSVPFVVGVT